MFILSLKGAMYRQNLSSSIFKVSIYELLIWLKNEQFFTNSLLFVCSIPLRAGDLIVTLLSDKFRLCQYKKTNADAKKRFFYHIISYIPMNIQSIPKFTFHDSDTFRYLFLLHWSLSSSVWEDHYHDVLKLAYGWHLTVYDKL